jgi:type IV pilus assembly protein PilX
MDMCMRCSIQHQRKQRGAVLIVSLILLLVMTVLAISGSQVVRLQERMANNTRDVDLALQGAEAGLRDAEEYIESLTSLPSPLCTSTSATGCMIFEQGTLRTTGTFDLRTAAATSGSWWMTSAREYRTAGTADLTGINRDPRFVIERAARICDAGEAPCLEADSLTYFRDTSQSFGGTQTADVRLESTYVRRGL